MTEQQDRIRAALQKLTPKRTHKKKPSIVLLALICAILVLTSALVSCLITIQADHFSKQNLAAVRLGMSHSASSNCVRYARELPDNKHP